MSPEHRDRRNRSVWLWLAVLLCAVVGAFFGYVIGAPSLQGFAGGLIGFVAGFAIGVAAARKSVRG